MILWRQIYNLLSAVSEYAKRYTNMWLTVSTSHLKSWKARTTLRQRRNVKSYEINTSLL